MTHSGTFVNISPACRRCVDGETVEAEINLHEHKSDRWILDLFQASLNGKPDFILMDISSTWNFRACLLKLIKFLFSDDL